MRAVFEVRGGTAAELHAAVRATLAKLDGHATVDTQQLARWRYTLTARPDQIATGDGQTTILGWTGDVEATDAAAPTTPHPARPVYGEPGYVEPF